MASQYVILDLIGSIRANLLANYAPIRDNMLLKFPSLSSVYRNQNLQFLDISIPKMSENTNVSAVERFLFLLLVVGGREI